MPPEWAKIRGAVRFLDQVEVSGMQIGISRRRHPVRPDTGWPCTLRAHALAARAYLIYHFMRRFERKGTLFYFPAPLDA